MRGLIGSLALIFCVFWASPTFAGAQDFQLSKLGNPNADYSANENFRIFANQLGVAISSWNLAPPQSNGLLGFSVDLEYAVAKVSHSPSIWPTQVESSRQLMMPALHLRKGLPWSFELGARAAYLQESQMVAASAELKWAVIEGFSSLPDLALRAHATRLFGAKDLTLTTGGLDLGIGHRFPVAGMFTLTPYGGWDLLFVSATSAAVSFSSTADGQSGASTTAKFAPVQFLQNHSNRFYLGLRYTCNIFEIAGEASLINTYGNKQILVASGQLGLNF